MKGLLAMLCLTGASAAVAEWKAECDDNPVPAIGQNAADVRAEVNSGHPRILFIGSSIRTNDCVRLLTAKVKAEFPAASFARANAAGVLEGWMREWRPDAVVFFGDENCDRKYDAIRDYLDNGETEFLLFENFCDQSAQSAERCWDRLEPLISNKGPMHLYGPVNFDPKKIGSYTLEDPLRFADGTPVGSPVEWPKRRAEILDIFAREMYGQPPPPPEAIVWDVIGEKLTFAGFARMRQIRLWFRADRSGPSFDWFVFLPRFAKGPVPTILQLNYRGAEEYMSGGRLTDPDETSHCSLPMILARGYAFMTARYTDIAPDPFPCTRDLKPPTGESARYPYVGVFDLWPKRDESRTDNTTVLGAWAWALSRGLDLAERMPETDATRAVVTGCSRLGKAAFIAAARDERFKVCVANQCGGGGITLSKRNFGESVRTEMTNFRHWYCSAYDKYVDHESAMPFDQHLMVAAIAPRALLVQGFDDYWYDTEGEYLSCRAASPVWRFLGGKGFPDKPFPAEFDTSCIGEDLGYVRRFRHHGLSAQDWVWLLDFADRALRRTSESRPRLKFLFISDHHVESDFVEARKGAESVPVYTMWKPGDHAALVETYRFINEDPFCRDADFTLFGGDQINTGYDRCPAEMAAEMKNYRRTLEALDLHAKTKGRTADLDFVARPWTVRENLAPGQKPYAVTPPPPASRVIAIQGNHDTGVDEFYRDCAFTAGGVRFIAFFASYVGLPPPPGKLFHSTAKISDETLAFVSHEMEKAAADPKIRHIVLVSHWAIAPAGEDFDHPILGPCAENGQNDNRAKLLALAEKYGCRLYLNGHEHNGLFPVGKAGSLFDINCGTLTASPTPAPGVESGGAFSIVEIGADEAVVTVYSRAVVEERDGGCVTVARPCRMFERRIPLNPL